MFDDLTKAILKEIWVLEAGYRVTDIHVPSSSTASFHVGLRNNSNTQTPKRNPICVFCKGPHPSHACTTVTEYPARIENLCFTAWVVTRCLTVHPNSTARNAQIPLQEMQEKTPHQSV